MKQIKNSKVVLTFNSSVYSRLDKDASKKVYVLVSATILEVTMCVALGNIIYRVSA